MRARLKNILIILPLILILGCGTVTSIRPIKKGESALAFSMGGPVTKVSGIDIPLPYTVARYRYGLTERITIDAGSHLLLFALGDIGLDGGISYLLFKQSKLIPAVDIGAGIYGFSKLEKDYRFFPELELTASYLSRKRFLTYFGVQSMYQLTDEPWVVIAPFLGEEVRLGKKFSLTLETKWFAPGEKTKPRVIDYRIPIFDHGALGFVLGLNYQFGGWYE